MDILAELQTAKDNYAKLEAEYKAANELLDGSIKEAEAFKATIADKEALIIAKDAAITDLTAALETAKQALADLEASQKTAKEQAVDMIATQGIAPIEVATHEGSKAQTKEEALTEYQSLLAKDSFKAGEFYAKNKSLLVS